MFSRTKTIKAYRLVQLVEFQIIARSRSPHPTPAETVDGVLVDQIATENIVQFGPQPIARAAWRALGLDQILCNCGLNTAQSATAQLLVANRLIEPVSERALIDRAGRTALPELLGVRITRTLIHILDRLQLSSSECGGLEKPLVILDAGFASKANLALIRPSSGF